MDAPSIEESKEGLPIPDRERLNFCFEQGTAAFAKVKRHEGWFVGVHMHELPFMEIVATEGSWSIGRKKKKVDE